ncbi:MAG: BtpA/SgcQ family protein [Candidatus Saccharimonadales bacterium]
MSFEAGEYNGGMPIEVYPIIHIVDGEQASEQAKIAFENGADGIFLIEKGKKVPVEHLTEVFDRVATEYPDKFVGVNYLPIKNPVDVFEYIHRAYEDKIISRLPDGVLVGNTTRDSMRESEFDSVELIKHEFPELRNIRYLGGIAYKYNPLYTDKPEDAAEQAEAFGHDMDMVVTSGGKTGEAPSVEKVAAIKKAIGNKPLAIASGINVNNVLGFAGIVDMVLVSTSLETEPYSGNFDVDKLRELVSKAHSA